MKWLPRRYLATENPQRTERRVELAALVLLMLFVLGSVLGGIRLAADGGPAPVLPATDSLATQALSLQQPLTDSDATRILERPVFWESRRPLAPPAPVAAPKPKPRAPAKLEGITLQGAYGTGDSLGLIATVDGKLQRIVVGQSVKGWQFTGYEAGVATFSSGGRRATLNLELTTPNVSVVAISQPVGEPSVADTGPETDAGGERQPSPEQLQRLRQEANSLTFGGSSLAPNRKSK